MGGRRPEREGGALAKSAAKCGGAARGRRQTALYNETLGSDARRLDNTDGDIHCIIYRRRFRAIEVTEWTGEEMERRARRIQRVRLRRGAAQRDWQNCEMCDVCRRCAVRAGTVFRTDMRQEIEQSTALVHHCDGPRVRAACTRIVFLSDGRPPAYSRGSASCVS
eukprot:IDg16268t1